MLSDSFSLATGVFILKGCRVSAHFTATNVALESSSGDPKSTASLRRVSEGEPDDRIRREHTHPQPVSHVYAHRGASSHLSLDSFSSYQYTDGSHGSGRSGISASSSLRSTVLYSKSPATVHAALDTRLRLPAIPSVCRPAKLLLAA